MDPNVTHKAVAALSGTIVISPDNLEGIKQDMSFHQHSSQLYSGGYGSEYIVDVSNLAWVVSGTVFEMEKGVEELLISLVLDGNRWMLYDNSIRSKRDLGEECGKGLIWIGIGH